MTEPTPLTAEQFLPFAVYAERLDEARRRGMKVLRPSAPLCPSCDEQATEIILSLANFIRDELLLAMRPCGHRFTISGDAAYEVSVQAKEVARQEYADGY